MRTSRTGREGDGHRLPAAGKGRRAGLRAAQYRLPSEAGPGEGARAPAAGWHNPGPSTRGDS